MSKDFKITLIVIFSIIGVSVLFVGTLKLMFYYDEVTTTKIILENSPEIVGYLKDNYDDNLKIIRADGPPKEYFEILVSNDFETKNEEISTKLYDISEDVSDIWLTPAGEYAKGTLYVKFILSDDKYIEFKYYNGEIEDISLNFAITQKELDKLSENNTEVHGYSLK